MKEEKIASGGELMYSDLFLHFGNGKNKAVFAEHSDNPILFIGLGGFGKECICRLLHHIRKLIRALTGGDYTCMKEMKQRKEILENCLRLFSKSYPQTCC